jgi:Ca-activated chloride channel family protein
MEITVSWQGPNAPNDYISIAIPESDGSSYLAYEYTKAGNPVRIQTPQEPGEYEIRYIAAEHGQILARSQLTIK